MLILEINARKFRNNLFVIKEYLSQYRVELVVVTKGLCLNSQLINSLELPNQVYFFDTKEDNIDILNSYGYPIVTYTAESIKKDSLDRLILSSPNDLLNIGTCKNIIVEFDLGDKKGGFRPDDAPSIFKHIQQMRSTSIGIMSILKFIIDKEYDTEMIYHMVKSGIYINEKDASKQLGLDLALIEKVSRANNIGIVKKELKSVADKRYEECGKYIEKTVELYQKSWDEIDKLFFNRLQKISGAKLKYKKYLCVVSLFHNGISNWNGSKVVRHWDRNSFTQRRITAHEIIVAHFFSTVRELNAKMNDNEIWKLAEVYAFALTGLDQAMKSFWPWDKTGNYTDHNYPELIVLQKELGDRRFRLTIGEFINIARKKARGLTSPEFSNRSRNVVRAMSFDWGVLFTESSRCGNGIYGMSSLD